MNVAWKGGKRPDYIEMLGCEEREQKYDKLITFDEIYVWFA